VKALPAKWHINDTAGFSGAMRITLFVGKIGRGGDLLNILTLRLRETLLAVLPITLIVLLLNFTLVPLGASLIVAFLLGAVLIIVGLALFLIGVDMGITPLGEITGIAIAKTNMIWIVLAAGFILGFLISVAEPGLLVFATQVEKITLGTIGAFNMLFIVSIGLALLVAFGLLRILYNLPLYILLTVLYGLVFVVALFSSSEFLAIAFDASGATTGKMRVFLLSALSCLSLLGTIWVRKF